MQYHGVGRHHDRWPHAPTCGCEWDYDVANDTLMKFYFLMFVFSVVLSVINLFLWTTTQQVAGRNYPPTNKNTLICTLTEEWDKLPQQLLDNVVANYGTTCECCITLHGVDISRTDTFL
ncbi:hypothetical protein TNCV_698821 [Trichonephila clavipes]|nr:hypothetical protein TNCV_698821 [Trichonephila clavipes]